MDDENKIIRITVEKVTKFNYFVHGFLCHWAITSLIQDSMGKEAYIENVQSNWIDGSVTIPLAIGVLVFVFIDIIFKIRSGA